ncbi:hypothetical protein GQ55_1G406200 [Panicum hallii var. hallii]|uniref:Uncharacterized protein n=1 Tax=Panicum hallii var. hallii TaxID=1504633 RepID=A0A2T7FCP8_9POAL|nr:hypothetical protein GQ55_1G406200 [Panicum hallii var. hallii]
MRASGHAHMRRGGGRPRAEEAGPPEPGGLATPYLPRVMTNDSCLMVVVANIHVPTRPPHVIPEPCPPRRRAGEHTTGTRQHWYVPVAVAAAIVVRGCYSCQDAGWGGAGGGPNPRATGWISSTGSAPFSAASKERTPPRNKLSFPRDAGARGRAAQGEAVVVDLARRGSLARQSRA